MGPAIPTIILSLVVLVGTVHGTLFSCKFKIDDDNYDLSELDSNHAVKSSIFTPPSTTQTEWYINPCGTLKSGYSENACSDESQICGIEKVTIPSSKEFVSHIIPLVSQSDYTQVTTNKISNGISIVSQGGKWGDNTNMTAIIDFICQEKLEPGYQFTVESWTGSVLHVEWHTPLVCKTSNNKPPADSKPPASEPNKDKEPNNNNESSSWGFFTWVFILVFLAIAGYVIGSAWINYNQYGLTGVELLPHADTIRDLPYLIRDFANRIANTFAGSTNRGGYSAV